MQVLQRGLLEFGRAVYPRLRIVEVDFRRRIGLFQETHGGGVAAELYSGNCAIAKRVGRLIETSTFKEHRNARDVE